MRKNRIIVLMGVSGSGKSTIGKILASRLVIPFHDGDDYHPPENKLKMKSGIPLKDEDRYSWLQRLNVLGKESLLHEGCVIACSALKESYRKILSDDISDVVDWIYLEGDFDMIQHRLRERKGHFMPAHLLASQFEILEVPDYAIKVSINASPEIIEQQILKAIGY